MDSIVTGTDISEEQDGQREREREEREREREREREGGERERERESGGAHGCFCTQKLLRTEAFAQRSF